MKETEYKYVVWVNYGWEGWNPTGYEELEDAINHESHGYDKVITSGKVKIKVEEVL